MNLCGVFLRVSRNLIFGFLRTQGDRWGDAVTFPFQGGGGGGYSLRNFFSQQIKQTGVLYQNVFAFFFLQSRNDGGKDKERKLNVVVIPDHFFKQVLKVFESILHHGAVPRITKNYIKLIKVKIPHKTFKKFSLLRKIPNFFLGSY